MSRCGCGSSSCSCVIQAGTNINITGTGTALSHFIVSSPDAGTSPDFFLLSIDGVDDDLGEINSATAGYSLQYPLDKILGGETLNLNLLTLMAGAPFTFNVFLGQISVNYTVIVTLWVSNFLCTEKLSAVAEIAITPTDSISNLVFPPIGSWNMDNQGSDLTFDPDNNAITSTGGGCYMAEMIISWTA